MRQANDFYTDLEYSLEERDSELFEQFYRENFPGIKHIEFVDDLERQKMGIDKVIIFESGYEVTVDEKKRRKNYGDILLEIWSAWEYQTRGWLYTCKCDYIVYAVMPASKVYILPSLLLKKVWLEHGEEWSEKYPNISADNDSYTTKSVAVPPDVLLPSIERLMEQSFPV